MLKSLLTPGTVNILLVNKDDVAEAMSQILGWPADELGEITKGDNYYDTPHGRVRFVNFTDCLDIGFEPDLINRRQTYISRLPKHAMETNEAVIVMQGFKWRQAGGSHNLNFTTYPSKTLFLGRVGVAIVEDELYVFRDKTRDSRGVHRFPFVRGVL